MRVPQKYAILRLAVFTQIFPATTIIPALLKYAIHQLVVCLLPLCVKTTTLAQIIPAIQK